jgi:parallel beta-helix repeat protein
LIENNICLGNGGRGISIYKSEKVIVRNNTVYHNLKHPEISGGDLSIIGNTENPLTQFLNCP